MRQLAEFHGDVSGELISPQTQVSQIAELPDFAGNGAA